MNDNKELITSDVALRAFVRLLKNEGYDLQDIKKRYDDQILGENLSGADPQYKNDSIALLSEIIEEA